MDYLLESLKTIRNLCETAAVLRNLGRDDLIPRILEVVLLEAQELTESYCIVDE